jgi:hypothetical protein
MTYVITSNNIFKLTINIECRYVYVVFFERNMCMLSLRGLVHL